MDDLRRRLRQQRRAAGRERPQPGGAVERGAEVVAVALVRLAGVERDPHAQARARRATRRRQRLAQLGGAGDRVGGAPEHGERRVALPLRLQEPPAVCLGGARDQLVVQLERRRHRVRHRPPTAPTSPRCPSAGRSPRRWAARGAGPRRPATPRPRLAAPEPRGRPASAGSCASIAALELAQPLARLDPELLDQLPARVLVRLQRVGLPVGAVEREHQLRAQALAVRVLVDQPLELRRPPRRGGRAPASPRSAARARRRAGPRAARSPPARTARRRGPRAAGRATARAPPRAPSSAALGAAGGELAPALARAAARSGARRAASGSICSS